MSRIKFWSIAGAIIFNLLLFIAVSSIFLNRIHHHWILPAASLAMGLQLAVVDFVPFIRRSSAAYVLRSSLLCILAVYCLIGLARVQTIFTCYQHCSLKLAGMWILAGLIMVWGAYHYEKKSRWFKIARSAGIIMTVTGVVMLVFYR